MIIEKVWTIGEELMTKHACLAFPSALALPQIGQSSSILFGEFHHWVSRMCLQIIKKQGIFIKLTKMKMDMQIVFDIQ